MYYKQHLNVCSYHEGKNIDYTWVPLKGHSHEKSFEPSGHDLHDFPVMGPLEQALTYYS
jgi:hypothetical protein